MGVWSPAFEEYASTPLFPASESFDKQCTVVDIRIVSFHDANNESNT